MTQEHISHPEGLPNCAAGHRPPPTPAKRCASAAGGHLAECASRSTSKHADPDKAIAAWRRLNRPARSARPAAVPEASDNVLQFQLGLAERKPKAQRAALAAS